MEKFRYQVRDKRGTKWIDVSADEVETVVRREMGDDMLEEVLNEMHVHGMEFPVDGSILAYRAVREDGSVIGYESACCGQCRKVAA